jgi:3-dehydroquinate dehydratase-2
MSKVLVLNGPNLQRLGMREPDIYGSTDYNSLVGILRSEGSAVGLEVDVRQTDSEAQMIQWLHEAVDAGVDVVINPAAFTHYSYAIRDAAVQVTKSGKRLIEVHLSNPHTRENFRHTSVISGVATGVIAGFGVNSYILALQQLSK